MPKKRVTKKKNPAKSVKVQKDTGINIGGWLIAIQGVLILSLLYSLYVLSYYYDYIFGITVLKHFITVVFSLFIIILFVKKSHFAPAVTIFYMWFLLLVKIAEYAGLADYSVLAVMILINVAINLLLTIYFVKSKRVKNTFIR